MTLFLIQVLLLLATHFCMYPTTRLAKYLTAKFNDYKIALAVLEVPQVILLIILQIC